MTEKILLFGLTALFIITFMTRNLLVRKRTGRPVLAGITVFSFHRMILHEEAHLLAAHGNTYKEYKARTGRYLPRFRKQAERGRP